MKGAVEDGLCVFSLCPPSAPAEPPPAPTSPPTRGTPYLSTYLEVLLAGIQVGGPAIVIAMEPALLRRPPFVRVGRGGTDLLISNPAGLHSQRDVALEVWGRERVKGRITSLDLKLLGSP